MNTLWSWSRRLVLPGLLLALASCDDAASVGPVASADTPRFATGSSPSALECPTDVTKSVSKVIDLLGGVLELDGHKLAIPLNAVLTPTTFTLTVPASNYVEIDITADGAEHFDFEAPVTLTLDYSRCTRSNVEKETLKVYYWDSATRTFLQDMGGSDDKTAQQVTTSTDHLSSYVVGTN